GRCEARTISIRYLLPSVSGARMGSSCPGARLWVLTEHGLWALRKEPVAVDVPKQKFCRCRRAHVLRGGPRGELPARSILRGRNPEGSQACGLAGGAADEGRIRN